jgi:hypothetical protein
MKATAFLMSPITISKPDAFSSDARKSF